MNPYSSQHFVYAAVEKSVMQNQKLLFVLQL